MRWTDQITLSACELRPLHERAQELVMSIRESIGAIEIEKISIDLYSDEKSNNLISSLDKRRKLRGIRRIITTKRLKKNELQQLKCTVEGVA